MEPLLIVSKQIIPREHGVLPVGCSILQHQVTSGAAGWGSLIPSICFCLLRFAPWDAKFAELFTNLLARLLKEKKNAWLAWRFGFPSAKIVSWGAVLNESANLKRWISGGCSQENKKKN